MIIRIDREDGTECFSARVDAILAVTRFDHYEGDERMGGGILLMTAGGEITLEDVDYEKTIEKLAWKYL